MLFSSLEFALFLPIAFILYWIVFSKNSRIQNIFLLLVSYLFYSFWDWRFLLLISFYSFFNFFLGIFLSQTESRRKRKILLTVSCIVSIGLLAFFKYFNFFIDSFIQLFHIFNFEIQAPSLRIILPVGISFYTFQTLSYTFDVYKGTIKPTKNILVFLVFVSFFPQLLAGPIGRASQLLPQFSAKRFLNKAEAVDGLRQILWGLFKKIVVADNLAIIIENVYKNYETSSGSSLLLGILLYSIQIYADFSGYSDIAIGVARLFGIQLRQNFSYPIFSRDVGEFWRRWHMSLQSWFREYLYFPLGGSHGNKWMIFRNTMIIFTVSGLWHGANWKFVIWGALNGLLFLPLILTNRNRKNFEVVAKGKIIPKITDVYNIFITYLLISLIRVFFRAQSTEQSISILKNVFSSSLFTIPHLQIGGLNALFITIMLITEWINRENQHGLVLNSIKIRPVRWSIYYTLIIFILFCSGEQQLFIYFQF